MTLKNVLIILFSVLCLTIIVFILTSRDTNLYVSPNGNDNNSGSKNAPFKSLEKAKNAVRLIKAKNADKLIAVIIKDGKYQLESPVIFTSDDSGTPENPIIYKAENEGKVTFSGSTKITGWEIVNDQEKLALLDDDVRNKVYKVNLSKQGISNWGDATKFGDRPDLFCNQQLQTLARWPNDGFTHSGRAKGNTLLAETYTKEPRYKEGIFEYIDERQSSWAKEPDVRLEGYWYWNWKDEFQKVAKIDTSNRVVYIQEPYHNRGYKDSLRYYGLNLLCELDQPGEWYLDRRNGELFWYPPDNINPNEADVSFSIFNSPYMLEMHDCSFLTIEGVIFEESRGSAVLIEEGNNCLISNCRIERFGVDGIHVRNGLEHGISACLMRNFGCGGIKIFGGDRKKLIPCNSFIENNIIEYYSLYKRTYEPAVLLDGVGIHIRNNRFSHSLSSAMRMEGNDHVIEYNKINHVVNESDDQGGLDAWGNPSYRGNIIRFNHWSDIQGGIRHGAAGIRLDDFICGVTIYGNIFERCGVLDFGGIQIHGGKNNVVDNNLFYKCHAAISFTPWGKSRWLQALEKPNIKKLITEDVDIYSEAYQKKYPELKYIKENPDVNTVKNNLVVDCDQLFIINYSTGFVDDILDNTVENVIQIESESKTVEELCSPEILKKYGLQPIPYNEIGPNNNKWEN